MLKIIKYFLIKSAILIILSFDCSADSVTVPSPMVLGVGVHLWGLDQAAIDKQLDMVKDGGFKIIRWDVPWKAVEQEPGQLKVPNNWDYAVNKANSFGIKSLLVLDYGNRFYDNADKPVSTAAVKGFTNYSQFVVNHFKGRVTLYQVWNEWDGEVGNTTKGTSHSYAQLLKSVYPAIKSVDNDAIVIGGSFSTGAYDNLLGLRVDQNKESRQLSTFLDENMSNYMDAIAIHPYVVYRTGNEAGYGGFERLLKLVVEKVKATKGFSTKPIYITELGWSTAVLDSRGVSVDQQKNYMLNAKKLASNLGVATFIAYELVDTNTSNLSDLESNFGFLTSNFSKKPIYKSFCSEK